MSHIAERLISKFCQLSKIAVAKALNFRRTSYISILPIIKSSPNVSIKKSPSLKLSIFAKRLISNFPPNVSYLNCVLYLKSYRRQISNFHRRLIYTQRILQKSPSLKLSIFAERLLQKTSRRYYVSYRRTF